MSTSVADSTIALEVDAGAVRDVRLSLPARPENVAVVRQAMTGVTEAVGIDAGVLADMKTAVSEACNNVVVHAYDGDEGPLEVAVQPVDDAIVVTVVDRGRGLTDPPDPISEPPAAEEGDDGVGLSLIAALSDDVDIRGERGVGTVVRMTFATGAPGDPLGTPAPVLAAVLGRMVAMLAARSDFSLDRLSDAQLVSDAISAHAPDHAADGVLRVGLDDAERSLQVKVGPLQSAGGRTIVNESDLPGVGLLLEQLVDDVAVEPVQEGERELLVLRLADRG